MKKKLILLFSLCLLALSLFSCGEESDLPAESTDKEQPVESTPADKSITLRVGSYNIQNGSGVGHDMAQLAADITELELDIVGLQEVDVCTSRAKGLDTLKLLSEATGYPYHAFTKSIDFAGGEYGTAILSRYPIILHESVELTTPNGYERRAYGHAVIDVDGFELNFFNSHLSYEDISIRTPQLSQLSEAVALCQNYIISGDFNTPFLNEFAVFVEAALVNTGIYITHPATSQAIDNIILSKDWKIVDSGMHISGKSDHHLLWTEIVLKETNTAK